jgi:hypothetical protein
MILFGPVVVWVEVTADSILVEPTVFEEAIPEGGTRDWEDTTVDLGTGHMD